MGFELNQYMHSCIHSVLKLCHSCCLRLRWLLRVFAFDNLFLAGNHTLFSIFWLKAHYRTQHTHIKLWKCNLHASELRGAIYSGVGERANGKRLRISHRRNYLKHSHVALTWIDINFKIKLAVRHSLSLQSLPVRRNRRIAGWECAWNISTSD